ncbi:MAG: YihY/virulence factor BrkB family protein [Bacteroidota bacterium]
MAEKFLEKVKRWTPVASLLKLSRTIVLPGFDKMPLYDVAAFFVRGLLNGSITTRASSIAFKFFVALFPAIIFFFTLIPYIPVAGFHDTLLATIQDLLPQNVYVIVKSTIEDIVMRQHGGLLSVGFVMALYFSLTGVLGVITAFNATYHSIETRKMWQQYLVSLVLVIILLVITSIAISLIIIGTAGLKYFVIHGFLTSNLVIYLITAGKWIVAILMVFFGISFLYYLAPARKERFRFISAGSTLATILCIATIIGFNFYVNNFGKYNAVYGSIGTLLVILMWFYLNALALLIGFELNASISEAREQRGQNEELDFKEQ